VTVGRVVRRVEGVADQQAARVLHVAALFGGRPCRARRQQQRMRRYRFFDAGPQLLLPLGALGAVLLHQVGAGDGTLSIGTLEGQHLVSWGDWIIQGVKGELYPCKPDIFDATYEAA